MQGLDANNLASFLVLTVLVGGFCAVSTGQALAASWRPWWQVVPAVLLLGAADRFLHFALFQQDPLSPAGYVEDTGLMMILALGAWRLTHVAKMVAQYPWVYERDGLWRYRERD